MKIDKTAAEISTNRLFLDLDGMCPGNLDDEAFNKAVVDAIRTYENWREQPVPIFGFLVIGVSGFIVGVTASFLFF